MAGYSNEWHLRDPDAVASVLKSDIYKGLDKSEVKRRRRHDGKNNIWHVGRTSAWEYAVRSMGDLTCAVLVIAALTAALFEKSVIAAAVCVILLVGVVFRVMTYVKARRILESLADEAIPSATVIRDGTAYVVRADDIVKGDVVVLGTGDIVPCDGRIVYGDEVRISEKGITENKTSVIKRDTVILTDTPGAEMPCEYRVNMLFAGSVVLAGECRIMATACGDDTLVSMRRGGLLVPSGEDVPVMTSLSEWCRRGSIITLLLVFLLSGLSIGLHLLHGGTFSLPAAFIDAMALAAASLSSYLMTTGYIALTVPIRHVAEGKHGRAIVKDISCIHKIADVNFVVASDVSAFKSGNVTYTWYFVDGEMHRVKRGDAGAAKALADISRTIVTSGSETSLAGGAYTADETEVLLEKLRVSAKNEYSIDAAEYAPVDEYPVDYKCERSAGGNSMHNVIVRRGVDFEIHISGNVREVLSFCDKFSVGGREVRLSDEMRGKILATAASIEARGGVIVAKSHRKSIYTTLKRLSVLQSNMCFDGFIVVEEALEKGAEELCRDIGSSVIKIALLSSNTVRDKGYLVNAGLVPEDVPVITCRDVLEGKDIPDGSVIIAVPQKSEDSGGKIDAPMKVRIATVMKLVSVKKNSVVITSDPSEAGMMTDDAVGAAVSKSDRRPIPQTLKRRAEISVYPSAVSGFGGFCETVRTVSAAVCSLENLKKAALYTVTSQFARFMCMLLSVIFDVEAMNAATILLLGMIFDFAAVLVLSFGKERTRLPDGDMTRRKAPTLREMTARVGLGSALGAAAFASAVVPAYLVHDDVHSEVGVVSGVTVALILMQIVMLSEIIMGEKSMLRSGEASTAYFMYALLTVATVLAVMFVPAVSAIFGDIKPHLGVSITAVAVSVMALAAAETVKFIRKKK